MIKLIATTPEELTLEINDRRKDIATEIVTTILYGIENNLNMVELDIQSPLGISVTVAKDKYLTTLDYNSQTLIEFEEYELLRLIQQIGEKSEMEKNQLNNKENNNKNDKAYKTNSIEEETYTLHT